MKLVGRILFLLPFSILFSCLQLHAQLQCKVFDAESGLSNSFVRKIIQDKTGYLWIGTTNGLNRFDGYSFKVFKHNPHDKNSIADNIITALAVDKSNRIWMGHEAGGVTCYDPSVNRFTRYKLIGDTVVSVSCLQVGNDGLIWIGVTTHGMVVLNPETGSLERINLSPHINKANNPKDLANYNSVFAISEDAGGIVWLATADGLYRYNKETKALKAMRLVDDTPYRISGKTRNDYFTRIISDGKGGFWLPTYIGGISHYHPENNSFTTYKYGKGISENSIYGITAKDESQFWITTERGLGTFDSQTKTFSFRKASDFSENGEISFKVSELFRDRANILWGASADGLVMVSEIRNSCVFKPTAEPRTLYEVNDIVEDPLIKKKFFATGFGKGLMVSDRNDNKWRFFGCRNNTFYGNDNLVQDLLDENKDTLWVVSRDNVRLFDKMKERWIDLPQLQKMETRITPSFYRIIKGTAGDHWIASYRNGGYRIKKNDFSNTNYKPDPKNANSICSNNLLDLLEDKLGRIWFASMNKGVSIYDPILNKFTTLGTDNSSDFKIPSNSISALTQDKDGHIWIASSQLGVFKMTVVSKDSLRLQTFDNDLLSSPALDILADSKNRIWFSDYAEVHVLNQETMQIKSFGKKNGLPFGGRSFIKDGDRVLLSGTSGYFFINEIDLAADTSSSPLVVNSLKIFGKEIFPSGAHSDHVDLPYDQNSLNINFAAINLSDNNSIRYSYQLEGIADDKWSAPSNNRSTEFAQLLGGDYIFKLKASNQDGIWGKERALLYIHINSPFWKTWWFYAAVSGTSIAVLLLLYNVQIKRIRNKEKEKSEMNERISGLQLKALYAQMSPHFIFNCLSAINGYIVDSEIAKASEFLTKFSKLMRMILENSSEQWITLEKEIDTLKLYLNMEGLRFEDKFSYQFEVDERIPVASLLIPSMIFQPYLENAIWHGLLHKENGKGIVSVKFSQKQQSLICEIEDNGVGREHSSNIKNRAQTAGKSFGLKIVSERLQLLHENSSAEIYDLKDASGQPTGTRVVITLITKKLEISDKGNLNR